MGKAGFIKHTDVENWFVKSIERITVLWVSLKMTSVRVMSCIYLVQILNLPIKINLGLSKTVWKIKWWRLHNCHFSFIEKWRPSTPARYYLHTYNCKKQWLPVLDVLSYKPSNYPKKPIEYLNTKCKHSKYHAI